MASTYHFHTELAFLAFCSITKHGFKLIHNQTQVDVYIFDTKMQPCTGLFGSIPLLISHGFTNLYYSSLYGVKPSLFYIFRSILLLFNVDLLGQSRNKDWPEMARRKRWLSVKKKAKKWQIIK